jgi:3-oxoacyl-[acyl-carrier protein] reductase
MGLSFVGAKVVVTGASSGVGYAIARGFVREGAIVVAHSHHNACPVMELQKEAREMNIPPSDGAFHYLIPVHEPISMPADLIDHEQVRTFINRAIYELGGDIDILINNAGDVIGPTSFLDLTYEDWRKTMDLDLTTPFFLSRAAFSHMKEHGGGKIINISSIAAKYGGSETTMHYGAAKAGLENITRSMARAGAPYNILVNAIQLGVVDTKFQARIGRDISERVKSIPLRRAARPEEVADLCLFIASKHGDYMTGQIYPLTGGD